MPTQKSNKILQAVGCLGLLVVPCAACVLAALAVMAFWRDTLSGICQSGSGRSAHESSIYQKSFERDGAANGGHGTLISSIVPGSQNSNSIGFSTTKPDSEYKALPGSTPKVYSSWAAGGCVSCRYHALLNCAKWWQTQGCCVKVITYLWVIFFGFTWKPLLQTFHVEEFEFL